MRIIKREEIKMETTREEEDTPIAGDFDDAETVAIIQADYDAGNDWAWCMAVVTAKAAGFKGVAYLGGCSYASREDFEADSGYLSSMEAEAVAGLMAAIKAAGWEAELETPA